MSVGFMMKIENASGVVDEVTAVLDPAIVDMVVDAVAVQYGWSEATGMSKARFFSYQVRRWAVSVLSSQQVAMAREYAAKQAMDQIAALEATMVFEEPLAP